MCSSKYLRIFSIKVIDIRNNSMILYTCTQEVQETLTFLDGIT
nr:MAG TPA: hypothetical protein [Caudoviricetes sp.]DAQ84528.1 MAG TPA: hypothetical protein [Caudoviricetes sp.]DAT26804.1 MAG TPA: hypothetical protein [Caudoviricetes sp.]